MGARSEREATRPAWSLRDLKRPMTLLVAAGAAIVAVFVMREASCPVHEVSHALVGTALGWEVDQVYLCRGRAEVVYASRTDAWYAAPLVGFAGGVGGAASIVAVYWLAFVRGDRPLRGPAWWGAGLGLMAGTGAQIAVGVAEGVIGGIQGRNYTEVAEDNLVSLIVLAAVMVAFGALHVWWWRALWQAPTGHGGRDRTE